MPQIDDLTRLKELMADDSGEAHERFQLAMKVQEMLMPFCKGGDLLDWRGHYRSGKYWHDEGWFDSPEKRLRDMVRESLLWGFMQVPQLQKFADAIEAGVELEEPISLASLSLRHECTFCGAVFSLAFNGKGFVAFNEACPYPDGLITEYELNVPSGKIVVDDDLRQWFPVDEDYNVNAMIGCHLSSLAAAKVGMAYGFVGNTSPEVYRNGEDKFVIGSYREDLWDREKNEDYPNPDPCPWEEPVASICTDLWWYSIADYDEFVRRVAHHTPDRTVKEIIEHWTVHVVDVKPGVYKFRQEQGVNRDAGIVEFATFEWVREPDPVRDYIQEEREKSYTATEVLLQQCLSWPTLYMGVSSLDGDQSMEAAIERWKEFDDEQRLHSFAHAARQAMFTSRADDWHENGFPRTVVTDEVKQLAAEYGDIGSFDFQGPWGSPSEDYDAICLGAGLGESMFGPFPDLAPSFVLLGLNICQSAIRHGEEPRLNTDVYPPAYEVPFARDNMAKFVEVYRAYRKKYPDIVFDEEFDRWMQETDLDRYVAEFDYGVTNPPEDDERRREPPSTVKKGDYFVFDASKIEDGSFCWAQGCWAKKEDAERYAIGVLSGTQSKMGHLHVDASARPPSMIPLKAVGRVLRGSGEGHSSSHLVVTFDYGTENMRGEMAFNEKDMAGVEQFSDEKRYAGLLEHHKMEYAKFVADVEAKNKGKKKAGR